MAGKSSAFYVLGGAGGESMMDEYQDLWKFDIAKKQWSVPVEGYAETGIERYDMSGASIGDGAFMVVFGGHGGGEFFNDVYIVFIGEEGM